MQAQQPREALAVVEDEEGFVGTGGHHRDKGHAGGERKTDVAAPSTKDHALAVAVGAHGVDAAEEEASVRIGLGATLEGEAKERYAAINQRLAELHTQFGNNVLAFVVRREA